jgi:hypothetical protein
MTPQEKELVSQLLQRLKTAGGQEKDPEAEAMIRRAVQEQPDAPYYLVQTVLMQDMALNQAQARLAELERQAQAAPPQQRSFLGGSVPSAGPWGRAPQQAAPPQPMPQRGSWGPQGMQQPMGSMMQPGAGSGFLRNAAATAMGVAGGALLFQGLSSMFGHGFGGGIGQQPSLSETVNNYWTSDPQPPEQTAWNDQGDPASDAGWDDSQDVAADDDGSGDFGGDDTA